LSFEQVHFVRRITLAISLCLLIFFLPMWAHNVAAAQDQQPASGLTDAIASRLLAQVAEGLQGRIANTMLSAFDLDRMPAGAMFKQQITAFINQTDNIRVHFKELQVQGNAVSVDVEMDATPHSDIAVPVQKHTQMRFTAENGKGGWKFVDVEPRGFFTLER
jgi:ABC-type transporter MlaC component